MDREKNPQRVKEKISVIKLVCINDKDKPECVSVENWLHSGEIYTCRKIHEKTKGYILDELDISKYCQGLIGFNKRRFRLATSSEVQADSAVKKLLKELNIKTEWRN
jgi:hypothetical protein